MSLVLFLHGPSSSGKSTLAAAIRHRSSAPFLHLSIDHLRDSGAWNPEHYPNWRSARPQFFSGFHRAIAGFADAGNDVIVEHILDTDGWKTELQGLLRKHKVIFIGLHTPLHTLNEREAERADRPRGSAETDFLTVHDGCNYDLVVDGRATPEQNAQEVLALTTAPPARSAFFQ